MDTSLLRPSDPLKLQQDFVSPSAKPSADPTPLAGEPAGADELAHQPAQLKDTTFASQPATPGDDLLPLVEGEPVSAPPSTSPPAPAAPADVYGVYDPSGVVNYLTPSLLAADETAPADTSSPGVTATAADLLQPVPDIPTAAAAREPQAAPTIDEVYFAATAAIALTATELTGAEDLTTAAVLLPLLGAVPHAPIEVEPRPTSEAYSGLPPPAPTSPVPLSSRTAPSFAGAMGIPTGTQPTAAPGAPEMATSRAPWQDIGSLPRRYQTTVKALQSLASARFMEQHWDAAQHLDVGVSWDAPPIVLQGREPVRVAIWMAKWAACVEFDPCMYKLDELDDKRTDLELLLEARVSPHRPWYLPITWLLPKTVPLQATVKLRISKGPAGDGSKDVVTRLCGRLHNLPVLPTPIRLLNGTFMGYLPAATEPLWSPLVSLTGDPSYRAHAEEHPSLLDRAQWAAQPTAAKAAERAAAATVSAADTVKGAAVGAAEYTAGTAERAAGMVDERAGDRNGVAGGVRDVVHTAAGAVRSAAETVKEGVESGAAKVADVAGHAKKKVAGR